MDERPGLKQTGMLEEKFSRPNCSLNYKRLQLNSVYIYSSGSKLRLILIKLPTAFSEVIIPVIDLIRALPITSIKNNFFLA